jgi:hypothetical protein
LVYLLEYMKMHGPGNIKFVNAKQAKKIYTYRNIKRKLYKINAAIRYNKKLHRQTSRTQLHKHKNKR